MRVAIQAPKQGNVQKMLYIIILQSILNFQHLHIFCFLIYQFCSIMSLSHFLIFHYIASLFFLTLPFYIYIYSTTGTTKACIRVSPFGEGFKTAYIGLGLNKKDLLLSSWAFHEHSKCKGADQIASLQRSENEQKGSASVERALGLLRLCNYDSEVFMKFKTMFITAVGDPNTSKALRKDLSKLTALVLDRHYHLHATKDIWFELARVNMGLSDYHGAHALFETSNATCGAHHVTHHNIGICRYFLGNFEKALIAFDVSLKMKSDYAEAIKWKRKVMKAMEEKDASGSV